jgi:hypothetical protein
MVEKAGQLIKRGMGGVARSRFDVVSDRYPGISLAKLPPPRHARPLQDYIGNGSYDKGQKIDQTNDGKISDRCRGAKDMLFNGSQDQGMEQIHRICAFAYPHADV